MSEPKLLEVQGLDVYYGVIQALTKVDLDVDRGEVVALIGPNGAGKSTLLRTIAGLVKARSGDIRLSGESIMRKRSDQRVSSGIALVPEGRGIFPNLTVRENLLMGGFLYLGTPQSTPDLETALGQFPILHKRQNQPGATLSGGEQQMLAVARALMSHPKLLLLDEPSMGLAPSLVQKVFAMIRQLRETGTTILLVEQNANAALRIADRVYVLEMGRIVRQGPADLVRDDDVLRAAYLGI